jgi:hypothetical protein
MTTAKPPVYQRYAWGLHLLVSLALVSSGLYILSLPPERNAGLLFLGFAALGILLSLDAFRRAKKFGWRAMWIYPITLGAIGISMVAGDEPGIGVYYLALALIGILAQVLSAPNFRQGSG